MTSEKDIRVDGNNLHSAPDGLTSEIEFSRPSSASGDVDDNYNLYKQYQNEEIDPGEAKRVLRKIDLRIMPILFLTYLLQYLDKNGINYASVYGLKKGTHLHGQDYSWLGSIFYFGYMAGQYPAGYLMQRLRIGKFLSCTTILWGVVLITTPACRNFAGIATNRFFLGLLESAVNPGFILIMSIWYTSAEQPLRLESYYCTNGIATMFGGLIGYAVGHITTGIARWMYVFLIFGTLSLTCGLLSLLLLPDLPSTAPFLTHRERFIAISRVASANRQSIKSHTFKTYQALQTLHDPKTYLLFTMAVGAQIPNSALTSFTSIIVASFGFSTLGTQYLQIPGGAVQCASLLVGGYLCTRHPRRHSRCITMITANTICIVGAALLVGLPDHHNKWGRLVALWLCYFQGLGVQYEFDDGPQTFKSSEAPGYKSAYIAMLVGYIVKLAMVVVLYIYMYSTNKKRDREAAITTADADGEVQKAAVEAGMHDMTEIDNKGFRYIL
ncbi:MAG: hypothetical protein Q9227_008061 [Pyrenula ochraceoflavens]